MNCLPTRCSAYPIVLFTTCAMPDPHPLKIKLSQQQRSLLEQLVRRHSSPQGLVERVRV
ncbi:MAG: hypothetical protein F6K55_12820, partial [Moorea sp. SIO4A3]|nr:hypothetical protein [Moorena sp. SIO4A3]